MDSSPDGGNRTTRIKNVLADTPFYNLSLDIWNEAESVKQKEVECRARACIAGMVMVCIMVAALGQVQNLLVKAQRTVAVNYESKCWNNVPQLTKICELTRQNEL